MAKNIKEVFDEVMSGLVIDDKLLKRIANYKTKFLNKNQDHIEFFGGNLIGVQVIRFMPSDRNEWFNTVLEVDEMDLEDKLYALPTVNQEYNISSDVFNLSTLWLAYAIGRSGRLPTAKKQQAQFDVMMVLNMKFITSLLFNYFKYPADEAVAKAAYSELPMTYMIKQEGSWNKVLERRSNDILDPKGIHRNIFAKFDNDKDIIYGLNDIQGRLRDLVKNLYGVFLKVHARGAKISSTSSVIETDGVEVLKDKTKSLSNYSRYITGIMNDRSSFIKDDLAQVIERAIPAINSKPMMLCLQWISDNASASKWSERIEVSVQALMVHAFDYLNANRFLMRNTTDLPTLISKLKGAYMASRSVDNALLTLRKDFEEYAFEGCRSKNDAVIKALRTGIMLYIVVRAISMKYYTNK